MKAISIIMALDGDPGEAKAAVETVRRQAARLPWRAELLGAAPPRSGISAAAGAVPVSRVDVPDGGSATRAAVLASTGDYVLVIGRGVTVPVREVQRLVPHLERGAQVVVGSRCLGRPRALRLTRAAVNAVARVLLLKGIRDALGGFTCYLGPVARQVYRLARDTDSTADIEAAAVARALGYTIAETPIDGPGAGGPAPSPLDILAVRWRLNRRDRGRTVRHAT